MREQRREWLEHRSWTKVVRDMKLPKLAKQKSSVTAAIVRSRAMVDHAGLTRKALVEKTGNGKAREDAR